MQGQNRIVCNGLYRHNRDTFVQAFTLRKFSSPSPCTTMSEAINWVAATFSKTETGQQEIQKRSLGLAPLVRRILVLVDGQRSGKDLAAFVPPTEDIAPILEKLVEQGCVQAHVRPASPAPAAAPARAEAPASPAGDMSGMAPVEMRTAKDNEMARNFMINSVNSIIGQQMRVSLIHDIFHAETTEQLRMVYLAWAESMSNHSMGAKRLPELREKLFKVL